MIITKDQLFDEHLKKILKELHEEWVNLFEFEQYLGDFDQFLWDNTDRLGMALYEHIGENFGNADDAAEQLKI